MKRTDAISLEWCEKHKEWWVMNCPDCMAETVEKDTLRKIEKDYYESSLDNILITGEQWRQLWGELK